MDTNNIIPKAGIKRKDRINMSNINEIQAIVKRRIPDDIWGFPPKIGWLNKIAYEGSELDPHNLLIKVGQKMEPIYTDIAKYRYASAAPFSIAGHGVSEDEAEKYFNEKYEKNKSLAKKSNITILTRLSEKHCVPFITSEIVKRKTTKKIDKLFDYRFGQDELQKLSDLVIENVPLQKEIREVYVDSCTLINNKWTVIEMKMSGQTDSGKTQQFLIDNIILPYVCIGEKPKQAFFGIITDNQGQTKTGNWKGPLASYLQPEMILIEDKLFDLVLPHDVSFQDFQRMVQTRLEQIKPQNNRSKK
jgi:hypothetical protein